MEDLFLSKTPAGKPKIVDNNGFCIATAPDATKYSEIYFERLLLSYNLMNRITVERLKELEKF